MNDDTGTKTSSPHVVFPLNLPEKAKPTDGLTYHANEGITSSEPLPVAIRVELTDDEAQHVTMAAWANETTLANVLRMYVQQDMHRIEDMDRAGDEKERRKQ